MGLDGIEGDRSGWGWAGWTEFLGWGPAWMNRIAIMGMGGDRSEWGWVGIMMDRIARMGMDQDGQYLSGWKGLSGWGWAGIGGDGQDCLDGDGRGWTGLLGWGLATIGQDGDGWA